MTTSAKCERWMRLILALSVIVPAIAGAQAGTPAVGALLRSGALSFLGRATVGDFVGTTRTVTGAVSGDFPAVRGWVEAPVATLKTKNDRRDHDLRASMDVDRYPTMRFDLAGATVTSPLRTGGDAIAVVLHGALAIHGVTRVVDLPAMVSMAADTIHVTAVFPLDLTDYHIGGLTKMLGLLRVQREIEVRVDLQFVGRASLETGPGR